MSQPTRETPEQREERLRQARAERVRKSHEALEQRSEWFGYDDAPRWLRWIGALCALGVGLVMAWARNQP